MSNETGRVSKTLFFVVVIMILAVMAGNLYNFFFTKNYDFVIETSCEEGEHCFIRHCGDGECPPNELERYKTFNIKASDFEQCSGDSCQDMCRSGDARCEEILCEEDAGDTCSVGFIPTTIE